MAKYYIAGIVPENSASGGGWSVYFPDVPQVAAGGESVAEAITNATSGLYLALRGLAEQSGSIPAPSDLEEVRSRVRAEREADGLPYPAQDTVFQYIPAPSLDMTPVRLNVSLPRALVEEMQETADREGLTRSGLLAAAANEYINRARSQA